MDGWTDRQTDGHFNLQKASAQRADALKMSQKSNISFNKSTFIGDVYKIRTERLVIENK